MKISDLTSDKSKQLAAEAGKRLAHMVSGMQLPAPKKTAKFSFKDFAIPQPIMEMSNPKELKQVEDAVGQILGGPVHCSRHFVERAFGRDSDVSVEDVLRLFTRLKAQHGRSIAHAKMRAEKLQGTKEIEIVAKDAAQDLNITFSPKGDSFELMSLMRKPCDRFLPLKKPGIENLVLQIGVQGLPRNRPSHVNRV